MLDGDPAFVGMEIQVIDTPNWRNLKPWQAHGLIYGVVPAKSGYRNPPASGTGGSSARDAAWKVTLNDVVIVEANLDDLGDKTLHGAAYSA